MGFEPEVRAELCVLSMSPLASCNACVDACPKGAWTDRDEGLGLDTDLCDGCGLCAPACPQEAIEIAAEPSLRHDRRGVMALAICTRAAKPDDPGRLPCLRMLDWRRLSALRRKGVTRLHVVNEGCDGCLDSGAATLDEQHALAVRLWHDRGIEPMEISHHDRAGYRRLWRRSEPFDGRAFSRRRLFRALADEPEEGAVSGGLYAHVPCIDDTLCHGCDTCARMCPTDALSISRDENGSAYGVDASACSGCGLCVDVCDVGAVSITAWTRAEQTELRLTETTCPSCDVPFRRPASRVDKGGYCDICRLRGPRSIYPISME